MKKCLSALLLLGMLLLGCASAMAATHDLSTLNGSPITIQAASGDIITGSTTGSVLVEMSGAGTLTLRDATVGGDSEGFYCGLQVTGAPSLTVILEGDNRLDCARKAAESQEPVNAALYMDGDLTITGEGGASLTVRSKGFKGVQSNSGNMMITGGIVLDIEGASIGVQADGKLTVTNGAVVKAYGSTGIESGDDITVSDGAAVTANGKVYGVLARNKSDVYVSNASLKTSNEGEGPLPGFPIGIPGLSDMFGELSRQFMGSVFIDNGYFFAENKSTLSIPVNKIKDKDGNPLAVDSDKPTVAEYSMDVKLTIQPGEGSGAVQTLSKKSGDTHVLGTAKEMGVTAPAGYMLDCWEVRVKTGGQTFRLPVGSVLTLGSDTTVTAVWKIDPAAAGAAAGEMPSTGDPSMLMGWVCLLGASAMGLKRRWKQ